MHFKSIHFAASRPAHAAPKLIVLGAVHGNEICGTQAIGQVVDALERGALQLIAGSVTFVPVTNPLAYQLKRRNGERNLNRNLAPTDTPREFEDHIANWLCPLLAQHDALLDLHSFQAAGGQPFVMVGPQNNAGGLESFAHAAQEQAWAQRLGVGRAVDGWLSTYAAGVARRMADPHAAKLATAHLNQSPLYGIGTTEYMRRHGAHGKGALALTLECGQHADPAAPEVAYRGILNSLAHLGLIDAPAPAARSMEGLRMFEVIDKAHEADAFARPWTSFDALKAGDVIGTRANGQVVKAPGDGYILFPNTGAQAGQEWFYLAQRTDRFA
jgi:predicted deacylase